MSTLLHIIAHPPAESSLTTRLANTFLEAFRQAHPEDTVDTLDLYQEGMPHLTAVDLRAMYWQGDRAAMPPAEAAAWQETLTIVRRFKSADRYLVTLPMWNFGVPSIMKAYIDHIILAGQTFQYTGPGASVGLLGGKEMVILNTRGGVYSQPPYSEVEMCVRYLRHAFGFLGIEIVAEIIAEGLAIAGAQERELFLHPILERARDVAQCWPHRPPGDTIAERAA